MRSMTGPQNHALVFGASGLIGWGVVNELLAGYPEQDAFSKVTAITNRPVAEPHLHWPSPAPGRPSLQLAAGVDLRSGTPEDLAAQLRAKVPDVESVTHVFYFGKHPVSKTPLGPHV